MTTSDLCSDDARKMDYLCGDLAAAEKREVERHLQNCPDCRSELHDLAVLSGRLRDLGSPECPEEMVVSAIAGLEEYERLGRRFRRMQQIVLSVLGLLALMGTFVLLQGLKPDSFSSLALSMPSVNFEIVRLVVVLVLLSGLPACLDGLGFLLVRRNVMTE